MPSDAIPSKPFVDANRKWECGRDGEPCRYGPDKRGRCCMRPECKPAREGDRWLCARPLSRGGACEKGPLPNGECCKQPTPCLPRLSPNAALRRVWTMSLLFFAGVSMIFLSSPFLMSPGKLMPPHTPMGNDCSRCHGNFEASPALMAMRALLGETPETNTHKCADCHRLGEFAMMPHSVGGLQKAAGEQKAPLELRLSRAFFDESLMSEAGINCTTCHRAHTGARELSPNMTDLQCQVCHSAAFRNIESHPQWGGYPHHDVPSVVFNHDSHFRLHFQKAAKDGITPPDGCGGCHRAGEDGNMLVRGFAACASCHGGQIAADNSRLVFLEPPGLDLETMERYAIGAWPEYAEAEPNAFLLLMLKEGKYMSGEELAMIKGLDLLNLSDASRREAGAAAKLALGFKELMFDLQTHGPEIFVRAAQSRKNAATEENAARADLAASMPPGVVDAAVRAWFPRLAEEMAFFKNGRRVRTSFTDIETEERENAEKWAAFGGWQLGELQLVYRPTGHADRFLRGWMSFSNAPTPQARALFDSLAKDATPGKCAKCHVSGEGADRRLNWTARGTTPETLTPYNNQSVAALVAAGLRREIKNFSHFSHAQAIEENGCRSCHQIAEDKNRTAAGFVGASVSACVECHNKKTELNTCTTCHNYHFPLFEDSLLHEGGLVSQSLPETKGEQVSTSLAQ